SGLGEQLLRDAARRLAAHPAGPALHRWVVEANVAGRRFYTRLSGRVVETGRSQIPAAGGKTVLRVHWPDLTQLA
ncbi:MAG: N-acetyltransferase, partial [Bradyrhizobium sp.]